MKYLFITLIFFLYGCDTVEEKPQNQNRTYDVQYIVEGTFDECTVTHIFTGKSIIQAVHSIPWEIQMSVTVQKYNSFPASISAVCISLGDPREVTVTLKVDGNTFESITATGTTLIVDVAARLSLDGVFPL